MGTRSVGERVKLLGLSIPSDGLGRGIFHDPGVGDVGVLVRDVFDPSALAVEIERLVIVIECGIRPIEVTARRADIAKLLGGRETVPGLLE